MAEACGNKDGLPICPGCQSPAVVKNGQTSAGRQNYRCKACGKQFVRNPKYKRLHPEALRIVKNLLRAGVAVPLLARAAGVSPRRLYDMRKEIR